LAAKSLQESQKGIVFAAALKMIIPLIVVIPGIIAFVMNADSSGTLTAQTMDPSFVSKTGSVVNDNAFPWLVRTFIPTGLKGLVMAALAAAIVSSLASMLNSTSTIFTMDIFLPYINKNASDKQTVTVGRISGFVALVIAMIIAPMLGNLGQAFQFIQEYTGVVSPGILAVFLTGLFWKRATNSAAIWGVIMSIPIAMYFKVAPNGWSDSALFLNLPFMHQMMITAVASIAIILIISHLEGKGKDDSKAIIISPGFFKTEPAFNIGAILILILCAFLYAIFW
jgi:SSS family solute:Na+ symporter